MLTIKIAIGPNVFEFTGDAPFTEARDLVIRWLEAVVTGLNVRQLQDSLKRSNDELSAAVAADKNSRG